MEQEKLAEMIKSLIEKDKENFIKKEGIVETKKYETGKEVSVNKKLNINFDNNYLQEIPSENVEASVNKKLNINFNNNYLQEIPFENVEVETEKALLINTTLSGYIWVNKKHCYKSKKYQFKPVFLIKVFNEMTYSIETNGDPDEPATIKGAHIKW